jgi:hypothetical protein
MITFPCTRCGNGLYFPDERAGQEASCSTCGQPVQIPAYPVATPAAGIVLPETLPPEPPRPADPREAETLPPEGGARDAARVARDTPSSAGGHPELYDFLAPAEGPGELGRLGSYRILRVLGAGGMGVVFQAQDVHLERMVAIKAMLPTLAVSASARQRFLREARAAAAIDHDHIVHIYQVGEDRGVPFLAMQFLRGESLEDRLRRAGRLPVNEVLRIGREIAQGLAAAHAQGLIHRDIKPANIWLETPRDPGQGARVKILDFGLARAAAAGVHLTQSGAILGTPAYMAPEQAGGKGVDHRCDLFSLGCVLYQMSTGRLPFQAADTISTLIAVATHDPTPPVEIEPRVPPALSELIVRLLAKNPNDRPASARAVIDAIRVIEQGQGGALEWLAAPARWVKGVAGRLPFGKRAAPDTTTPPAAPAPPARQRVMSIRPSRLRPIPPLPGTRDALLEQRRRSKWRRWVVLGVLVVISSGGLRSCKVTEGPGDDFTIQIGDKTIAHFHSEGNTPKQARKAAEAHLKKSYRKWSIESEEQADDNHVTYHGTIQDRDAEKPFDISIKKERGQWKFDSISLRERAAPGSND